MCVTHGGADRCRAHCPAQSVAGASGQRGRTITACVPTLGLPLFDLERRRAGVPPIRAGLQFVRAGLTGSCFRPKVGPDGQNRGPTHGEPHSPLHAADPGSRRSRSLVGHCRSAAKHSVTNRFPPQRPADGTCPGFESSFFTRSSLLQA